MLTKVFLFLIGLAVGAAVCAAVLNSRQHNRLAAEHAATAATFTNQIASLNASLASTKAQLEEARQADDRLTAQVQGYLKREPAPPAAADEAVKPKGLAALFGGGTNGMSEAMTDMMKAAMEQQVEGKLATMKAKLNLTPDQEAAIRTILTNQIGRSVTMTQKMFSGGLSGDDVKNAAPPQNEEEQIKALLTPDQLTAYDDYKQEDKRNNARLMANAEMLQMQSSLQLDEDQQNKVYEVLFNQAQNQFDFKATNLDTSSPMDMVKNQLTQKAEALKAVLTPDQFDRYQKFQDQQMKMIEAFMPKTGTN